MANKVNGNLTGIKNTIIERIKAIYEIEMDQSEFASIELINALSTLTGEIDREISVYIARNGSIVDVSVGDSSKVSLPNMRLVRNEDRLCGVRCIHTHPNGDGRLSGVDIGTLRSSKLDCMAALGVLDGKPTQLYAAYLGEMNEETDAYDALIYGPLRPLKLPQRALIAEISIRTTDSEALPRLWRTRRARERYSLAWRIPRGTTRSRSLASLQGPPVQWC